MFGVRVLGQEMSLDPADVIHVKIPRYKSHAHASAYGAAILYVPPSCGPLGGFVLLVILLLPTGMRVLGRLETENA